MMFTRTLRHPMRRGAEMLPDGYTEDIREEQVLVMAVYAEASYGMAAWMAKGITEDRIKEYTTHGWIIRRKG
jgi:hypothetical protein